MYLHSMLQGRMPMKEELLEEARIKWHSDHIYKKRVKKKKIITFIAYQSSCSNSRSQVIMPLKSF